MSEHDRLPPATRVSDEVSKSAAPADAVAHAPWPAWKVVVAYAVLTALAVASIAYVDLKAHQTVPPSHPLPHATARHTAR